MLLKDGGQRRGGPLGKRVDFLNQTENVGRHNQQIADRSRSGIPIRMGGSSRYEHGRPCASLDLVFAGPYAERSLKDIPGFVVTVVNV